MLVHDYLLVMRGAERTFASIADCWSDAPIQTLLYDSEVIDRHFGGRDVTASPLQRLGVRQNGFRRLLPVLPLAARRLPVADAKVVISSSSAFAHGVRPGPDATHVCYCHSPFRYAWHERQRALDEAPGALRPVVGPLMRGIREWDRRSTETVTHYIANSVITQQRIHDFWGRESEVIHPPVSVDRFSPRHPEDYFLFVGEVTKHKRVELALKAAEKASVKMKVVGDGPELERLRALYGEQADFLGRVDDQALAAVHAGARALIVPNIEEFGIAAVEAQASGRPVVAADKGGALETVVDGETGVHFPNGEVDALAEILRYSDFEAFDSDEIVANAERFSEPRFKQRIRQAVSAAVR